MIYTPDMTLGEARKIYFERSGFGQNGGYDDFWIKIKALKVIPIWLPNTNGRVAAVKLHDLHHVLTEYQTTWAGETEISAWEIGSGGLHWYWEGWLLDLWSVAIGLAINPIGVYGAFMRGRCTSNLFDRSFSEDMLDALVGEYRHKLKLDRCHRSATWQDAAAFILWACVSVTTYLLSVFGPIAVIGIMILWSLGYAI